MRVNYKNAGSAGSGHSMLQVSDDYEGRSKIEFYMGGGNDDVVLDKVQVRDLRDRLSRFLGEEKEGPPSLIEVIEE